MGNGMTLDGYTPFEMLTACLWNRFKVFCKSKGVKSSFKGKFYTGGGLIDVKVAFVIHTFNRLKR